ncbi:MAG: 3'-5' exonuclease [Candidatus Baltobacteraceae bacterium]
MDGRYAVIDVETTGFSAAADRVVEMACVVVRAGQVVETWSSLVNPGRAIPARATAVHGITDGDVWWAPMFDVAQARLYSLCSGATVVAHNARFDLGFLPRIAPLPSLCTVELARRAFPNAPNHKNQTLRAYLGIDRDPAVAGVAAHRALGDALITAAILVRCMSEFRRLGTLRAWLRDRELHEGRDRSRPFLSP